MSEKQLREGIDCHLCPEEAECYYCNKARKALADDPDVVAVLRILDKVEGMMISADLLADQLRSGFRVRLLEHHRWEWTE